MTQKCKMEKSHQNHGQNFLYSIWRWELHQKLRITWLKSLETTHSFPVPCKSGSTGWISEINFLELHEKVTLIQLKIHTEDTSLTRHVHNKRTKETMWRVWNKVKHCEINVKVRQWIKEGLVQKIKLSE